MDEKYQIFTPNDYVLRLLDSVNYKRNIQEKYILENSCGDGKILEVIVRRYIEDGKRKKIPLNEIKEGLEKYIYGIEIDKGYHKACLCRMDEVATEYGLSNVVWNLHNTDFLKKIFKIKFDYIVGNPPYINYAELNTRTRLFVKESFDTCKEGKFDYCYAFIEAGMKLLNDSGKLSYIIPSSIFKTVFGKKLREFIKKDVKVIQDFSGQKVFEQVLVSSAIMVIDKTRKSEKLLYINEKNKMKININKTNLSEKWFFIQNPDLYKKKRKFKFGDFFLVSHTVATLLNKAFVIKNFELSGENIKVNNHLIECELIKDTASPRMFTNGGNEKIIFPYKFNNGIIRLSENDFIREFPNGYEYLLRFKDELKNRDSDLSAKWFEYGRSQAIGNMNQEKLLISTVITEKVNTYYLEIENIPYAGMYIIPLQKYSLNIAKRILESVEFYDYVKMVGISVSGNSLRITSKDIMNYYFEEEYLT